LAPHAEPAVSYAFHTDAGSYFAAQRQIGRRQLWPRFGAFLRARPNPLVLEIGCGEAGVLAAFLERGCRALGLDSSAPRVQRAARFLMPYLDSGQLQLGVADAMHWSPPQRPDLIILKDVLEHLVGHEHALARFSDWLRPGGRMFLAFPPWAMPFGGHQQLLRHPVLCRLPWIHLLPEHLLQALLRSANEPEALRSALRELRASRVTLDSLESTIRRRGWKILERTLWFSNPIYAWKFGIPALRWPRWWGSLRGLRDVTSTAAYYVLEP
jgi:SAM-dependent methyltransferase